MRCRHEGEELKWREPSSLVYLVLPFISHDEGAMSSVIRWPGQPVAGAIIYVLVLRHTYIHHIRTDKGAAGNAAAPTLVPWRGRPYPKADGCRALVGCVAGG